MNSREEEITGRHRAEEALRRSEESLRTTLNSIGDAVIATDTSGNITRINPVAAKLTGWNGSEAEGRPLSEVFRVVHALTREPAANPVAKVLETGETVTLANHTMLIAKDDAEHQIADSAAPIRDGQGTITGAVLVFRDVTEEYRMREKLRQSEERFRRAFEVSGIGKVLTGLNGVFFAANQEMRRMLGYTEEEMLTQSIASITHPDDLAESREMVSRLIQGKLANHMFALEKRYVRKDGTAFSAATTVTLVRSQQGDPIHMMAEVVDTTERKQTEDELRKARNYISNIIDSMPSVLIGVNNEGVITQWNREAERVMGLGVQDAVGRPLGEAVPRLRAEMAQVRRAIAERREQSAQKRACQVGGEIRYEDVTVYPLIADGVDGAVIRVDDVTDQVHLEEMMVQSEKMISVGGLAAGMAHEINNPLAGMLQTAEMMSRRLTRKDLLANRRAAQEAGIDLASLYDYMESRSILRMCETIDELGHRVAEIVNNMLSFARKSDFEVTSCNVAELLDKTLDLASSDYDLKKQYDFKSIKIVKEYEENLPPVPCQGAKIQQVLLNILRNGAQAMSAHLVQRKASGEEVEPPRFVIRLSKEEDAEFLRLEIEDNGPGMDEEIRKRIFEPFYTTKPVGEGTGLGLSVSYFIITENHGGTMSVVSEPANGATFIIRLPLKGRS